MRTSIGIGNDSFLTVKPVWFHVIVVCFCYYINSEPLPAVDLKIFSQTTIKTDKHSI